MKKSREMFIDVNYKIQKKTDMFEYSIEYTVKMVHTFDKRFKSQIFYIF